MTGFSKRRARAALLAREAGFSAFAFVPGPNFRYLTGLEFHLMERPTLLVLTSEGEALAIMPELERSRWRDAFPEARTFFWQDSEGFAAAFRKLCAALAGPVGVEGMRMRIFEFAALRSHLPHGAVVDAEHALAELRTCKDSGEITAPRRAVAIGEAALDEQLETARTGDSEVEIAARLKQAMPARRAEGFAFGPIVLSGPKSADPRGTPGNRAVAPGEPLLVDLGASRGGMNADITRTFFCKHVPESSRAICDTVLAANARGREVAGQGIVRDSVDRETTAVPSESPFAETIKHRTGHRLGLDLHEAPHVMMGNEMPLAAGMAVTIEPGLCRSGELGIRIEDDVLITEDGSESLTRFPREVQCFG